MHFKLPSLLLALAMGVESAPFLERRDTCTTNDLNLPSDGMHGYNGVHWGFLPDNGSGGGTRASMSTINAVTGKKASIYGYYSQISSLPYTSEQLLYSNVVSDVEASGAVFIPAIMPTNVRFSDITPEVGIQIANVLDHYTSNGVEVWLRFAREMNYYVTDGKYAGGTQAEFKQAWINVYSAIASNPKILLFWSPNVNSIANLNGWWPRANYVNIVSMDIYPNPSKNPTFASIYGKFYDAFAVRYNKHFAIGETGAGTGAVAAKETWVKRLTNSSVSGLYPCYKSATWFEYYKGGDDFRMITGQSGTTVRETLSNFA